MLGALSDRSYAVIDGWVVTVAGYCGWSPIFLIGRGGGWLDIGVDAEGLEWDVAEL